MQPYCQEESAVFYNLRDVPISKQPGIVTQAEVLTSKSSDAFSGTLLRLPEIEAKTHVSTSSRTVRPPTHFASLMAHDLPPQLNATCGADLHGNV